MVFKYGLFRSMLISLDNSIDDLNDYKYMLDSNEIKSKLSGNNKIIGLINNAIPIIENINTQKIYIFNYSEKNQVVMIAPNAEKLISCAQLIQVFWNNSPSSQLVNVDKERIAEANNTIQIIKNEIIGCDINFWIWQGFPGINNPIKL